MDGVGEQSRRADRKGLGKCEERAKGEYRSANKRRLAQFAVRTSPFVIFMYPPKLEAIINLFESLPEIERRETLVSYADNAKKQEPRPGEKFALEDVRKDEECADTVGVYLQVDDEGKAHFRMTLGPEVQTLTRAMTAILCKGLDGRTPQEVLELPSGLVTRIVGAELVRVRSQTTYYVLTRIKGICKVYLDRQRMAAVA